MIVDSAIYVNGKRAEASGSLEETYSKTREVGGVAWIGLYKPSDGEFGRVAEEFSLHELAVEDAIVAHQRPKLERYGDTLFVVLRAARYLDGPETVEFAELHAFVGPDFVVTVRHGESPDLSRVRHRMEAEPDILGLGTEAILYAILDRVVDDYGPVVAALMAGAEKYGLDLELQQYLRDVQDHAIEVQEQVAGFRELLQNVLSVNQAVVSLQQNEEVKALTQASLEQNDEVKRISAWAAILFAPTLIGTIYGMNFDHMPELQWRYGYPFSLFLMALVSVVIYSAVRRRGWLS